MEKITSLKDCNVAYKMAWSFTNTTGIEFEDLIGEALLSYVEAMSSYDKKASNISFNQYSAYVIRNRLIDYAKKENRFKGGGMLSIFQKFLLLEDYAGTDTTFPEGWIAEDLPWSEFYELFSGDCKSLVKLILNEYRYSNIENPKKMRGRCVELMREQGWSWPRIWATMKQMKSIINN